MRVPPFLLLAVLSLVACAGGAGASAPAVGTNAPIVKLPNGATTLAFTNATPQYVTVSEVQYAGSWNVTSSNTAVVTIAVVNTTAQVEVMSTATATLKVTPVASGSATISVADVLGHTASFGVTVAMGSGATPTPVVTATPTPTPTAPPPGVLSVNPTTVNVYGTGAANAAQILAQETGYSGSFAESNNCASIASIAPASASGPTATFTVTGINAGTCSANFTDANSQHIPVSITVTTSGFTVQTVHGKDHRQL